MLTESARTYNHNLLRKLIWMSRQLGRYNDPQSIIYWSNAIIAVKNLLFASPGHPSVVEGQPPAALTITSNAISKAPAIWTNTISKAPNISCTIEPSATSPVVKEAKHCGSVTAARKIFKTPLAGPGSYKSCSSKVSKPYHRQTKTSIKSTLSPQRRDRRIENLAKASRTSGELTSDERMIVSWLSDVYGPIKRPLEDFFRDMNLNVSDSRETFKTLYEKLRKKETFPKKEVVFSRLAQLLST